MAYKHSHKNMNYLDESEEVLCTSYYEETAPPQQDYDYDYDYVSDDYMEEESSNTHRAGVINLTKKHCQLKMVKSYNTQKVTPYPIGGSGGYG